MPNRLTQVEALSAAVEALQFQVRTLNEENVGLKKLNESITEELIVLRSVVHTFQGKGDP